MYQEVILGYGALRLAAVAAFSVLAALPLRAADPLDINVVLPLTGGAAFLGRPNSKPLSAMSSSSAIRAASMASR
jgi:hypothetical protein